MAKCTICNSKKGKRDCIRDNTYICSTCCGETRRTETCSECSYFVDAIVRRKYSEAPSYSIKEMEENIDLQVYSNAIEGTLVAYDNECQNLLKDEVAVIILELLLDKYHFKEEALKFPDKFVEKGFEKVESTIRSDLSDLSGEQLVKVLNVIRFVANRRARGGRDYFNIIHQYVGNRIGPGIRMFPGL